MPRHLKLSPLQRDVMVTLEEAGAETIGTLIATIKPDDVRAFNHEIDGLIKLGLVRKEEPQANQPPGLFSLSKERQP